MTAYGLLPRPEETARHCGTIGGAVELPVGTVWPRCRICDDEMVAFFNLRLPKHDSTSFAAGSLLHVFACRQHDDICGTIYSDYSRFGLTSRSRPLPVDYWDISDGHYLLRLMSPSLPTAATARETRLGQQFLELDERPDWDELKLFGEPDWLQDPEDHICACGASMELLLQIPEGFGFEKTADAPEQPNSFSQSRYCLFLGNQLYLMGCSQQCHPMALWPVLQGS